MATVLLVGIGGLLGTIGRFLLGGLVSRVKGGAAFPYETFTVNMLGCLAIGLLAGLAEVWLGSSLTGPR